MEKASIDLFFAFNNTAGGLSWRILNNKFGTKMAKTYECFLFGGEDILDLHLKVMWDHVDYFVIAEGEIDFRGNDKPRKFDWNKYGWARAKIRYLPLEKSEFDSCTGDWDREFRSRDLMIKAMFDLADDDRVLITDVDEIINPDTLQPADAQVCVYEQLRCHFYGDYICLNYPIWRFPASTSGKIAKERGLQNLRIRRKYYRNSGYDIRIVPNGGWHFSYLGGVDNIILKNQRAPAEPVVNNSGDDYESPDKRTIENITKRIRSGMDIYGEVKVWGRVSDFHFGNDIVQEWFKENPIYLAPRDVKFRGRCSEVVRKFQRLPHMIRRLLNFYIRIRHRVFKDFGIVLPF